MLRKIQLLGHSKISMTEYFKTFQIIVGKVVERAKGTHVLYLLYKLTSFEHHHALANYKLYYLIISEHDKISLFFGVPTPLH